MPIRVCMSVCPAAYLNNHMSQFHQMFCMLPAAMVEFSPDSNAIYYALPVLWMVSCFHIMHRIDPNQKRCKNAYVSSSFPDGGTSRMSGNTVWSRLPGGGIGGVVCHLGQHLVSQYQLC